MKQVDVVIVNWNSGLQLRECVSSLLAYGEGLIGRIIVVDNGSTDGSLDLLGDIESLELMKTGENLGFARGCNLGAARTHSEYILFLNPDACIRAGAMVRLFAFMAHPDQAKVGICGIQLIDDLGQVARSCARFPTVTRLAVRSFGLDRLRPSLGAPMTEWDHSTTRAVDQVIGAFFLVRQELFLALKGFDERYFVYYEEVDFSLRAAQSGWLSVYLAEVQAYHSGGGTSQQVKAKRLFYNLRSRLLFSRKHFNPIQRNLILACTLGVEPLSRSVVALLRGDLSALGETFAAYRMLGSWLSGEWEKAL